MQSQQQSDVLVLA